MNLSADRGEEPSLPPGHPPVSAAEGGMPSAPPASNSLQLKVPDGWKAVEPRDGIIRADLEFALPKAEGDKDDGRLTVMAARGSIEMNIERWRGQFEDLEDKPVEQLDLSGTKVTLVDFSGTYNEQQAMMGPVVKRPGYRMLAAIIEKPEGMLFVKGYGPVNTMAAHADEFRAFVESLATSAE
ncbi:MAG: hypothetical protein GXX96_10045 [Planctomycetaceae bacterium]|nr:hypothetical protein [Planctomycetaceae bacterium]